VVVSPLPREWSCLYRRCEPQISFLNWQKIISNQPFFLEEILVAWLLLLTFDTRRVFSARLSIGGYLSGEQTGLLQGTLDMLILNSLAPGPLHGLGVARRIEQVTRGTFLVKPGSLFPALHRMEAEGWLTASWGESDSRRRAKYYQLTKTGRRQLEAETVRWGRVSLAITRALEAA
jgi:PadR family transcriptional regulator PadR